MLRAFTFIYCLVIALTLNAQGIPVASATEEITIENCARINDTGSQFGPALYGNQLVYVTRPKRGPVDPRTKQTYYTLFRAELAADGTPDYAKRFSVELSSNYNEGPVGFTMEDRVIYFTRTQLSSGATIEDQEGRANLGIFSAFRAEYDWAAIRNMPFNGAAFSNQHPSLTKNGRRIFFSSNREGGYGGYDLYFSDFRDGRWGSAINLGPEINTEANEAFPFIHPSGRLFFSSNGHHDRQDYDLYVIDLSGRRWGKLVQLPEPLNSFGDDVGLIIRDDARQGYLASNRKGGKGADDIYLLNLRNGLSSLSGADTDGETVTLYDAATSQRVSQAEVWLLEVDELGRTPAEFYTFNVAGEQLEPALKPIGEFGAPALKTDRNGELRLELIEGKNYELVVFADGFRPERLRFAYSAEGVSRPLAITMQPANCRLVSGKASAGATVSFAAQNCERDPIETTTDALGYFETCLPDGCNYLATARKSGYYDARSSLTAAQLSQYAHPRLELLMAPRNSPGSNVKGSEGPRGYVMEGLEFFGSTTMLKREDDTDLKLLAKLLTERSELKATISTHADGPENPETLLQRSRGRAETIRRNLLRMGVTEDRLQLTGYGNQYPRRSCTDCTTADYDLNTRTEVIVE